MCTNAGCSAAGTWWDGDKVRVPTRFLKYASLRQLEFDSVDVTIWIDGEVVG